MNRQMLFILPDHGLFLSPIFIFYSKGKQDDKPGYVVE